METQEALTMKLVAARELLGATKRSLQLVDEHLSTLSEGRIPVLPALDVSSEHRTAMFSAIDDQDNGNGISLGTLGLATNFGFGNGKTGTIRTQEDAAFVCTNIMVAIAVGPNPDDESEGPVAGFFETEYLDNINPALRLTDGNTGRRLVTGVTVGPAGREGAIPFSYLSSIRPGLGSNVKNKFFSEFTIPRSSPVNVEVFNLGLPATDLFEDIVARVFVTLLGFKVYGG